MDRTIPMYKRLQEEMARRIRSGDMTPGARVPGEMELCRDYGISRSTVRLALAGLEAEGLITRRRGQGTFVADADSGGGAESLPFVGIVAPRPGIYLAPRVLGSIRDGLRPHGYGIRIYDSRDLEGESDKAVRQALSEGARGIILQPPQEAMFSHTIMELVNHRFPLVLFDRPYGRMTCDCVMTDNTLGGILVGRHLLSLGHRSFAFVAESSLCTRSVQARLDGFLDAIGEGGVAPESVAIIARHRDQTMRDDDYWNLMLRELEAMFASSDRPSAVFAVNDQVATHAVGLARTLGLGVPGDLAVVGFDDSEVSRYYSVPLTTVEQPLETMGRMCADLVVERINGGVSGFRWHFLEPGLIVRESCGGGNATAGNDEREMIS